MRRDPREAMLARERVAEQPRHWVRLGTACNNSCCFCLDGDQDRDVLLPESEIRASILRGREERHAERLILSGGEASIHPAFTELVRYGKSIGYAWVQTISNGLRFAEPGFLTASLDAGLDEITYSVHGHTAELHDRLTRHTGAFARLVKAIAASVADGRAVVSVDILLCRANIATLDRIVEFCIALGIRQFDLLNVIPQGRAFENADELLYEPADYLDVLHKVLRLGRHPRFVVWTNRLPARYLEGYEEFIQDPHKLHDEVLGRARELRAYLDEGTPLPCRHPERCRHCFMLPFCAFVDALLCDLRSARCEVFWNEAVVRSGERFAGPLPFGCRFLGLVVDDFEQISRLRLPREVGLLLRVSGRSAAMPPADFGRAVMLRTDSTTHLEAWLSAGTLPPRARVQVLLRPSTAAWLQAKASRLGGLAGRVSLYQDGHNGLWEALHGSMANPATFFRNLGLPLLVSGLPPCLTPGARTVRGLREVDAALFDPADGRVLLEPLTDLFIREGYQVKSLRCAACAASAFCPGVQIHQVRARGFGMLSPLPGPYRPTSRSSRNAAWSPRTPVGPAPALPPEWRRSTG